MATHDSKVKRNDNLLKNLPAEVLLKARSTLVSLGGALKPKQEQHRSKTKHEIKDKKKNVERLKTSRSEPEFSDVRKSHRSRMDDSYTRDHVRPRPLSVGALKRYDKDSEVHYGSYSGEVSPLQQRQFNSTDEMCVQSRLLLPVNEKQGNQTVHVQETIERPRKKLSFREPEIVNSGSGTLGRSSKIMGVNSLSRRPRKYLRPEPQFKSLDNLDFELESQAMKIVRTVGQAFEVCHKLQEEEPADEPVASTSSAGEDVIYSDEQYYKDRPSNCGVSDTGGASTSKAGLDENLLPIEEPVRPKTLELQLPPPPSKGKRSPNRNNPAPSINLPELPECVTKVEVPAPDPGEVATPLSAQHQVQLLRERLDQQAQQTSAAVAQLMLLRDQLAAEQAARCEAQARTHQLLVQNKELLEHIAALVAHLQERERDSSQPINAQQLTLLPQIIPMQESHKVETTAEVHTPCDGNQNIETDALIDLLTETSKVTQNVENNNMRPSPFCTTPTAVNGTTPPPTFAMMTDEQIQNYLVAKFEHLGIPNANETQNNQHFFQNSNAFPHIPPLSNHFSNTDLKNILQKSLNDTNTYGSVGEINNLAQAMSVGQSETSLYSTSQLSSSKDSSSSSEDELLPFIMPLSHKGTLTTTSGDGRLRIIVPVSPSTSSTAVSGTDTNLKDEASASTSNVQADQNLAPPAPITRTTSEKIPNRSEMMTALRSQWTRHTTK